MNLDEIRKWHSTFKRDDELFEIRLLGDRTWSGYFYDVEQAIEKLQPYDNLNIYFSVNEVKRACASRSQFGCFQQVKGTATSKQDIEHRWWIPIDVDCERPSGVSSTDAEKELAHRKAGDVYRFLKANGFPEPIVCDSSSGYHIYIPVDMDNTPEVEQTVKTFLETLGNNFTDDHVKIDNVLFDANRIIRLPGSYGRKGRSTDERPHRQAKILSVPKEISRIGKDFIDSFNGRYKVVTEQPARRYSNYNNGEHEEFNLRNFISSNGISVSKEIALPGGGTKFVLTECLFDSSHKSPDAAIFEMPNGAIAYKCFHQSCSCHDWKEVRLMFDPHAYDPRPAQYQQPQYRPQSLAQKPLAIVQPQQPQPAIKPETPELGKKWLTLKDIEDVNINELPGIKTGYTELDKALRKLYFSSLVIMSGSSASGKSTWLNSLLLNAIEQGEKVALWSGELNAHILKGWIKQVAAGKEFLRQAPNGKYWFVPDNIKAAIDDWTGDNLFIYNNEYSNKWEQLFSDMEMLVDRGVRIFMLDNLFSMDIDIFDGDSNKKQKALINQLVEFKKKYGAIVILVAHPRKTTMFIRKTDISGTSAITDAADYIFIMHRVNNDFRRAGSEFFGAQYIQTFFNYSNVLEVSKDRMWGTQDFLVGMFYEIESRRFKNTNDEKKVYGWRSDIAIQPDMFEESHDSMPFGPTLQDDEMPF